MSECQHAELRRNGDSNLWYCVEPTCPYTVDLTAGAKAIKSLETYGYVDAGGEYWKPPLGVEPEFMPIDDDALRALWLKHGGVFENHKTMPHGAMLIDDLLVFLRSLITGDPLAARADGAIVDEREAKSERDRFEAWMQCYQADHWPNADENGSRVWPDGTYRNKGLHHRWEAWQAAQSAREVADRAQRIEFAAVALGVVERRRDELLEHLRQARAKLAEQPQFVAVRGCQPGDIVFLTPARDLMLDEINRIHASVRSFARETGIKIAILPAGFVVNGKEVDTPTPPIRKME